MKSKDYDSLYKMLVDKIETDISSSRYEIGDKYLSVRGLARKYKVSLITSVKAVEELCAKGILQSRERSGLFVAKVPLLEPLHIHYLIKRDTEKLYISPFHAEIIAGARQKLLENNCNDSNFHLTPFNAESKNPEQELRSLLSGHKTPMAIFAGRFSPGIPQALKNIGVPFVMTGTYRKNEGLKLIKSDAFDGTIKIIENLRELGHSKILYLRRELPEKTNMVDPRADAVLFAKSKYKGLKFTLRKIKGMRFEDGLKIGAQIIQLVKEKRITAIMAYNDDTAVGVMHALHDKGFSIPEDISIVGYDDFPIARQIYPPLTTIKCDRFQMGKIAVQTLLDFYNGKEISHSLELLPDEIILRKSACPPQGKKSKTK
jgi:DNA-binding LacI/PurR family transcriptional regulator